MRIRMGLAIAIAVLVASSAATLAVSGALTTTRAQFQSLAAAGSDVVCGIRTDATLDCWGRAAVSVVDPPPGSYTAVSAARRVACGLRRDASMACWGRWWTEIGADASVHPPSGTFSVVDLAEAQGCAIRTSGALACFGARDQRGSVDDVETIAEGMEGRDIDRYVRETPPLVPPAGTFLDVAAVHDVGGGCAIRTAGTLECWGDDSFGQASPPSGTFVDVAAGRWTYCAIRTSGELACWGLGLYGAAEPPAGRFTSVAIGGDTGCAIRARDRTVACWGADLGEPTTRPAAAVAVGDTIAAAILSDGTIRSWGETRYWPVWGYGQPPASPDFGVFRLVGSPALELVVGVPVDDVLRTTLADPAPRFHIVAGRLPPGVELTADGRLRGTPVSAGRFGPVTVEVDNGMAPPVVTTIELAVSPAG